MKSRGIADHDNFANLDFVATQLLSFYILVIQDSLGREQLKMRNVSSVSSAPSPQTWIGIFWNRLRRLNI